MAVIVILAIIALIATPQIMKIIKEAQDKSLEATKNSIIKASELYVVRNLDRFSLTEGEKTYIQLSELEDGYIKKIKGTNGKSCEGYVKVEKTKDDFDYTVYLDCGNGDNLLVDSSYVNYGGNYLDEFRDVIKTKEGGYVAVGYSNSTSFSGNQRYGDTLNYDAIIVKYDKNGLEEWSHNFGGSGHDYFYSVIDDGTGYVVVGQSVSQDGDMTGINANSYNSILVKYDYNGKKSSIKIITSSSASNSRSLKVLYRNGYYYVVGDGRNVLSSGNQLQYIIKLDNNFNEIWKKTYGGTYGSYGYSAILNSDDNIVMVGMSGSDDLEMSDIKIGIKGNRDAVIFEIDSNNGDIINKGIFGGTDGNDEFLDVLETEDGYIAVGFSLSTDHDMSGLSLGSDDAIVVKYRKNSVNGILPIEWKRVIGGSEKDQFRKILKNGNELLLIGYSNSKDDDLLNITKTNNTDYDGLIVKINLNGEIISKKTYGGSQSDYFYGGIYDNNKYIIVGNSFSIDGDIESFNLGNSDAMLVSMDNDLNVVKNFKLETLLMNKAKDLVVNYGSNIPLPENKDNLKLYTTNDATNDLGGWCSSDNVVDPNSNYIFTNCLYPFDESNIKRHYYEVMKFENTITMNANSNWIRINFYFGNVKRADSPQVNNLLLKFAGNEAVTVEEAVNLGYIEPLVLIGGAKQGNYFFENVYNILNGGSSGIGNYPASYLLFKLKDKPIEKITFSSSDNVYYIGSARCVVEELLNFDISLTPNNN